VRVPLGPVGREVAANSLLQLSRVDRLDPDDAAGLDAQEDHGAAPERARRPVGLAVCEAKDLAGDLRLPPLLG
jgi:hypothetical protein